MSCAGSGPRLAPTTEYREPSTRTDRRVVTSHSARMTSIASESPSTASPGVSRGPPIATIASQNAPEPKASSNRPPDNRSSDAAERASTAGWRSGRFSTFGATRNVDVDDKTHVISVQVSRNADWYG